MSAGQSFAPGKRSARYSRMASDSQTRIGPSIRSGTLAAGPASRLNSGVSNGISFSSNGMPAAVMAIHGRSDQDE